MTGAKTALSTFSLPHLNTSLTLVKFTASTQQKIQTHQGFFKESVSLFRYLCIN